jgi:hypothetical protein
LSPLIVQLLGNGLQAFDLGERRAGETAARIAGAEPDEFVIGGAGRAGRCLLHQGNVIDDWERKAYKKVEAARWWKHRPASDQTDERVVRHDSAFPSSKLPPRHHRNEYGAMSGDPILAALARLETGQGRLETEQTRLRVELMERMDRLQSRLDVMDEHLTMGLGFTDRVDRRSAAQSEDNRLLGELLMSLTRLVRRLEGRVNGLEAP